MTRPARTLVASILAVVTVSVANPVWAQDQQCEFDRSGVLRCIQVITARPGGPELDVPLDPTGGIPLVWRRVLANGLPQATFTCVYEIVDDTITTQVRGVGWATMLINVDTGEILTLDFECEYPGDDPPSPPPPPPTVDIWREASEDALRFGTALNPTPGTGGITGLDTWFWCDDPGSVTTEPLTTNGWTVTATVEPIAFTWNVSGSGAAAHTSETCGRAPSILEGTGAGAAWIWTPESVGTATIAFTSTWAGTWILVYEGINTGTFLLGPVPIEATPVSYPVAEFVSVLTAEASNG